MQHGGGKNRYWPTSTLADLPGADVSPADASGTRAMPLGAPSVAGVRAKRLLRAISWELMSVRPDVVHFRAAEVVLTTLWHVDSVHLALGAKGSDASSRAFGHRNLLLGQHLRRLMETAAKTLGVLIRSC